ncbi:MAG: division/cell wall cluster transcriptional repressor MraZ [Anaerovoracaceae bacterium]|jgi:MraZ protein
MFMGTYHNSIDAKNRMIIPAKYRDELGLRCVISRGFDQCLYIYPMEAWEAFAEKLMQLPKADARARSFVRHCLGNSEECEIDRQGRVTIPAPLRDYGHLEKELVTIGNGEKIEIWSRSEWDSQQEQTALSGSEIAQGMENYGI